MKTSLLEVMQAQAAKWAKSKGLSRSTSRERLGFRKSVKAYERRLAALEPTKTYKEIYYIARDTIKMAEQMTTGG